ncbi:MAG: hypothetical protein AAFQ41_16530 [Cyanobacteria bacterium J06623_7]
MIKGKGSERKGEDLTYFLVFYHFVYLGRSTSERHDVELCGVDFYDGGHGYCDESDADVRYCHNELDRVVGDDRDEPEPDHGVYADARYYHNGLDRAVGDDRDEPDHGVCDYDG